MSEGLQLEGDLNLAGGIEVREWNQLRLGELLPISAQAILFTF
jgi:hypothetical protein